MKEGRKEGMRATQAWQKHRQGGREGGSAGSYTNYLELLDAKLPHHNLGVCKPPLDYGERDA